MEYWLYEDNHWKNFLPLVYFRPIWQLWIGASTLVEKWQTELPIAGYWTRRYLHEILFEKAFPSKKLVKKEDILFINARVWPPELNKADLEQLKPGEVLTHNEDVIAFRGGSNFQNVLEDGVIHNERILEQATQTISCNARVFQYIWDFIDVIGEAIHYDLQGRSGIHETAKLHSTVTLIHESGITIGANTHIGANVVLDASDGPIGIGDGVKIMHNSVIQGPAYIGAGSTIKIGAKIYENTSLGPVCKIGGEVEGSVVQGYSNKQHEGFLGHAILGSWVNLGADTNNSDLKNNYGEITVFLNGTPVNTEKRFLGLIMGDHSKTGINTMFNTGTIVGVNCNIFGAEMPPKFVPSFSWGGSTAGFQDYLLEKAIEVARIVMHRRKVQFTDKTRKLFEAVYQLSKVVEKRSI